MTQYKKFIAQLLATVAVALVGALTDNVLTTVEAINIVVVFLGAVGVLGAGELPYGFWSQAKGYVAAATAAATLLVTLVGSGGFESVTTSGWLQVALAAVGAVGVVAVSGPVVVESNTNTNTSRDDHDLR